jgi:hypothetical protein
MCWFIFICAYIVWVISPSCLASRQYLFWPLQFCWREDISNNKKDSIFASWDKDSYTERFLALLPCTSVLQFKLIISTRPLHYFPVTFPYWPLFVLRLTILDPLQWAHETLSSFGFPTFPYSSCMCPSLSMWPMINNITEFVLDLKFAYEGEHTIFGFLSLANFT